MFTIIQLNLLTFFTINSKKKENSPYLLQEGKIYRRDKNRDKNDNEN